MLFNSWEFAFFFIVLFAIYYLPVCRRQQVNILILGSLWFYFSGSGQLLFLLLLSIAADSIFTFVIRNRADQGQANGKFVVAAVSFDLLMLCIFKYGPLIAATLLSVATFWSEPIKLLAHAPLPLGISFYCFEGISLTVDGAKKLFSRQTRFGQCLQQTALFISFFPHLISGPILRAGEFLPQVSDKKLADINWNLAAKWLILGYFLKIFVADNLQEFSFALQPPYFLAFGGVANAVSLVAYSLQIFADFAGYSFIAMGLAFLLGYDIPNNFNAPYISQSLREFWTRWHISLSRWMRDYVFIPLGGSRTSRARACLNVMFVMTISGLWHGASWNFALWGVLHGVCLVIEHLINNAVTHSRGLIAFARVALVFSIVTFAWIAFIYDDFGIAKSLISSALQDPWKNLVPGRCMAIALFGAPVVLYHAWIWMQERSGEQVPRFMRCTTLKAALLACMLFACLLNPGPQSAFIYFQF